MSKDKIQLLSPLFLKYQADFEKNPRSRVFAPLAETYRKLGMTDKAMEILSQGIRFHPGYVMGYLGLAFCYFDLRQFSLAYSTLRPLVETSRDNIRFQKLFADTCLELGYKEEALDTFKYLLFINPRDKEVALQVSTLERSIEDKYKPVHQPIYIPESEFKSEYKNEKRAETNTQQLFDVEKLENRPNSSSNDFDDWMALDLSRDKKHAKSEDPYEFWSLKKGDGPLDLSPVQTETITEKEIIVPQPSIAPVAEKNPEPAFINQPYVELDFNDEEESADAVVNEAPLVTHTLVDLYCGQGHIEKALEVLEKILILNPNDEKTIKKISEIKSLMGSYAQDEESEEAEKTEARIPPMGKAQLEVLHDVSEEDGRKNLMSIFDQQIKHVDVEEVKATRPAAKAPATRQQTASQTTAPGKQKLDKNRVVEEKLTQFLKKIQKRALDYQARS